MRSPRVLAVDAGAGHVACGVFSAGATGRLVLQQFAFEKQSSDPAREPRWIAEVAQSLGVIAARQKFAAPAALAVPGHLVLLKFLKTHSVEPAKRRKIIAFEAAENIPHPLPEVVWDYMVVADDSFDLEVMLAAAKFETMHALCAAADAAGFPVQRAIPAGLALCHGFRYNHPGLNASVVVADVGARSTQLLFLEGSRFYVRTLALGGNAVTQAVAGEVGIDFAAAEALKQQVLAGTPERPVSPALRSAVHRATTDFSHRLQLEITRSTLNHRRHSGGAAPVALYLAGGGTLIPDLPATLAEKLQLPVERYDPLRGIDVSGDARAAGADSAGPMLAGLVGLATRLVAQEEVGPSLLPPEVTATIELRKRQPWFLAAAALLIVALLPPLVYLHGVVRANQAGLARLEDRLAPLRSLQNRNDENLRQIEAARKQVAALRAAYETKANWLHFFSDLQGRLVKVEDVWLDRLQVVRQPAAEPVLPPAAETNPAPEPAATAQPRLPLRLTLSGRLLDVKNPQSRVSPESLQRVQQLVGGLAGSQFIAAVENEHFDNTQNGLLRFDFTLVINPKHPL